MGCSKDSFLQIADSLLLVTVFLFQSVILNYLVINQFIHSSFTFLWFLGDFLCLLLFAFTLYLAYRVRWKERHGSLKGSNSSRNSSRIGHRSVSSGSWPAALSCYSRISRSPFSYIAWIFYSCTVIAKIIVLFKAKSHPSDLKVDEFFGPQMLKISVSLSAIIFSLLVEAHYDSQSGDAAKNSSVKSMSYGMALEILDSVSFLSLLIVKETHLLYTFTFESFILGLSSINLMLPAVGLYKLTVTSFGETPLLLEILYKFLHLFLVNIPYLSVRIYLWQYYSYSDTSVFLVKNIYAIIALLRAVIPDLHKAWIQYQHRKTNGATVRRSPVNNGTLQNGHDITSGSDRKRKDLEEVSVGLTTFKSHPNSLDNTHGHGGESDKLRQTPSPNSHSSGHFLPN